VGLIVAVAGAALLIRGLVLEVLLAASTGGLHNSAGPLETRWSLVWWNPWFAIGSACSRGLRPGQAASSVTMARQADAFRHAGQRRRVHAGQRRRIRADRCHRGAR
jgi:hypothetical protein